MCHPAWARARLAAQRLNDFARLRRVRDRIDREYAQPLSVEALARGADMPAGHLSRQFRLAYGASPYAYLMMRRIERARTLLHHGEHGVTELSAAVGCSSPETFSARFTELVGMSPSAYRRVPQQVARSVRNREAPTTAPKWRNRHGGGTAPCSDPDGFAWETAASLTSAP